MLIAVPNCQGRVSPVFDVATRLVLVQLEGRTELERREVVLCEERPDGIVRGLGELGIEVLVCGAISQGLKTALESAGIRVVAQVCGGVEAVVAAYRAERLNRPEFAMPGCYSPPPDNLWRHRRRCRKRSHARRPRSLQPL